jgi:UDP-glucuronate 4-epimerase
MYKWVKALYDKQPLILNNFGNMWRDYTFVDDTVSGIIAALDTPQALNVYNLGRGEAVKILDVVDMLQEHTGIKGEIEMRELPDGEVLYTMADITKAKIELGYEPKTSVYEGTRKFVKWYKEFHRM